ncbi:MAG: M6 family metalloprotease domain-containing protein [Candidatus Delongbacteria bacterium]|jgi:M6 family metalloprotease-like protein|nr:M6 family metalloprotease domain-containing protein [Candidatus Delongbacteria bacterium]
MNKFLIAILSLTVSAFSAYFTDLETTVIQPDGSKLELLSSGDEFYNYLHDYEGYKIIRGNNGYFYYAKMENGEFTTTNIKAGTKNVSALGLDKNINISDDEYRTRVEEFNKNVDSSIKSPPKGVMNNLTIYIKFADQEEFDEPRSVFDEKFNSTEEGVESLKNYYLETSYDQLEIDTYHYPECADSISLSYTSLLQRFYFMPYDETTNPRGYLDSYERTEREHTLLKNAVESISDQIPPELNIDIDNDGYVDNICFVIKGPHTAWAELLWAHKWALYSFSTYLNGKQVYTYTFQPENQNSVRVLAHEMFHAVGAPDLYHYSHDGISPAGPWDIMESGSGHMTAYMKYYYGNWISAIPEITTSGEYYLNPIASRTNNCYMIKPSESLNDFYIIEYRKKTEIGFERYLPGSGLIVYKINEPSQGNGNSDGPPDELFIFREDGSSSENGNICNAFLSADIERTEINDYTNPQAFITFGGETGLNISNISEAGETISFSVNMENDLFPPLCSIENFRNGAYIPYGTIDFPVNASSISGNIQKVDYYIDDQLTFTDSIEPYSLIHEFAFDDLDLHEISATASSDTLHSSDQKLIRIFDPEVQTWFRYYSDAPFYSEFNRGSLELKIASVYDLGDINLYANKISVNISQDPYGFNDIPGEFNCSVYRFENDEITDQLLADLGTHISPMEGRFEQEVKSTDILTGEIAVVMDIGSYQSIQYDLNGIPGNNYIIEPDRPWQNTVSRGLIGALDMGIMLSKYPTSIESVEVPNCIELFQNYPNPFNPVTEIKYSVSELSDVELTVYNTKGEIVNTLVKTKQDKGNYSVEFNAEYHNSGIYFYKLSINGNVSSTKKMILLK